MVSINATAQRVWTTVVSVSLMYPSLSRNNSSASVTVFITLNQLPAVFGFRTRSAYDSRVAKRAPVIVMGRLKSEMESAEAKSIYSELRYNSDFYLTSRMNAAEDGLQWTECRQKLR